MKIRSKKKVEVNPLQNELNSTIEMRSTKLISHEDRYLFESKRYPYPHTDNIMDFYERQLREEISNYVKLKTHIDIDYEHPMGTMLTAMINVNTDNNK